MATPPTAEGTILFHIPGISKPCHTWYKIIGIISATSKPPLILLHGGPGACHNYLLPLIDLWENYNIPVIFYDQIGNGLSTHLDEKYNDKKFWIESLFIQELDNLIDHFDLRKNGFDIYGQSWGGMLGSSYAALKPQGLRRLVIANSPAASDLWVEGLKELINGMPKDVQEAFDEAEKTGNYQSEAYQAAVSSFYKKHMCRLETWPKELQASFEWLEGNPTVYGSM
jgi:proline-specific peptidase